MIELATRDTRFKLPHACLHSPVSVGRDSGMQWVITHWRVARRHAVLLERSRTLWIQDLGTWSGTWVNGKRIVADTPLLEGDRIVIGPVTFSARWVAECLPDDSMRALAVPPSDDNSARVGQEQGLWCAPVLSDLIEGVDSANLGHLDGASVVTSVGPPGVNVHFRETPGVNAHCCETADGRPQSRATAGGYPHPSEKAGVNPHTYDTPGGSPRADDSMASLASITVDLNPPQATLSTRDAVYTPATHDALVNTDRDAVEIRQRMQLRLLSAMDLRREDVSMMSDQHLRARARAILESLIERDPALCPPDRRERYITAVIDEAVGLGPLEPLLADASISEIMVNRHDEIFVERAGRLERANIAFANDASVLAVLERIVAPLGRRIDEGAPMVDARLADGSRVNGVIAPISLKGPTLTIRKFSRRRLGLDDLVANGAMSASMAAFLRLCVRHKKNIVVSGGTGSGKTTLLNILSGLIGRLERIITIEDAAELQLPHAHVVSLEARPPNIEGRGSVSIRDLVRNALRMRPDRIIVGECRGGEAFDMLAAMNTGHEGSLTTLHANTPRDALARLETMILMTGMPLPLAAVREHISAGIDIVVQQARLEDGRRVLTDIAEVSGMDSGGIQLQTLFVRSKGRGHFEGAGVLPSFVDGWRERGIEMPAEWFDRTDLSVALL